MTALDQLVQTPFAKALGWTLFYSLWEGAFAAMVLLAVLFVARSPRVRYACACLAMLAIAAGFCVTFYSVLPESSGRATTVAIVLPSAPVDDHSVPARTPLRLRAESLLPWMAPFWMVGVVFFHLRNLTGWINARRLCRRGVCPAPDAWQQRLIQLRERLRVSQPVKLLESGISDIPVVIGYLCPVILVPAGLLAGMPAGQLEALLLHELAHIRRRDYLVNLLQTATEGFLFYHPAIWWISKVIRAERENCCDDLAVSASGNRHEYAAALTALEQTRLDAHEAALAATGGSLMIRVRRLLIRPECPRSVLAPFFSAAVLMVAATAAVAGWQAPAPAPAPAPEVSPYTKWLNEDVVYIIEDRERAAFERLTTKDEREHFIEQFWLRRDPTPGTPKNEFKEEHYRRIAYADGRFTSRSGTPGWKTDRGRIYIQYGPPDEIESHPTGGSHGRNFPWEAWRYRSLKDIGTDVIIEFVDKNNTGDYRMTTDPRGPGR